MIRQVTMLIWGWTRLLPKGKSQECLPMDSRQEAALGNGKTFYLPFALIVGLIGISLFLTVKYCLAFSDVPDSIGYMQASHQLAQGEGLAFSDPHNRLDGRYYTLHTFKVVRSEDRNRYLDYPPGFPLLAASFERVSRKPEAVHLLVPIMATLLVATTCFLGAFLFKTWTGFWAGFILLMTPTFLRFSTSFWSEVPATAFLYVGYALCILGLSRVRSSNLGIGLTMIGGLAIGATFFMRFSNLSILPAIVVLLLYARKRPVFEYHRAFPLIGVMLVSLAAVLAFNTVYYGGPFTTSYTPRHGWYDQPAFSLSYAFGESFVNGRSVPAIGKVLFRDFGWLLLLAPIGISKKTYAIGALLLSLILSVLLPYTVYTFAAAGINSRFILPAWPAICLLIGQGIATLLSRLPSGIWRWALACLIAFSMSYSLPGELTELQIRNQSTQRKIERIEQIAALTEPNAVIMSYVFNDLVAVYGHRSVLNYRHIVPYDPLSRSYLYSQFESILVRETNRLLDRRFPVYYIYDSDPPLLGSYEILKKHFELTLVKEGESIYRIARR